MDVVQSELIQISSRLNAAKTDNQAIYSRTVVRQLSYVRRSYAIE